MKSIFHNIATALIAIMATCAYSADHEFPTNTEPDRGAFFGQLNRDCWVQTGKVTTAYVAEIVTNTYRVGWWPESGKFPSGVTVTVSQPQPIYDSNLGKYYWELDYNDNLTFFQSEPCITEITECTFTNGDYGVSFRAIKSSYEHNALGLARLVDLPAEAITTNNVIDIVTNTAPVYSGNYYWDWEPKSPVTNVVVWYYETGGYWDAIGYLNDGTSDLKSDSSPSTATSLSFSFSGNDVTCTKLPIIVGRTNTLGLVMRTVISTLPANPSDDDIVTVLRQIRAALATE